MKPLKPLPEYDLASLYPNTKVLSSSQVVTYLKDPKEFYITYLNGVTKRSLPMDVGRIFSAAYADRSLDYAAYLTEIGCKAKFIGLFGQALSKFPVIRGSIPEFPMIGRLGNGWEIRATLDDYHHKQGLIIENKTGKMPWTQERADQSPQVTIQEWTCWNKHGKMPKRVIVNWWNTGITSYPHVETYITSRSLAQLKDCEELMEEVVTNIEAGNFSNPII